MRLIKKKRYRRRVKFISLISIDEKFTSDFLLCKRLMMKGRSHLTRNLQLESGGDESNFTLALMLKPTDHESKILDERCLAMVYGGEREKFCVDQQG